MPSCLQNVGQYSFACKGREYPGLVWSHAYVSTISLSSALHHHLPSHYRNNQNPTISSGQKGQKWGWRRLALIAIKAALPESGPMPFGFHRSRMWLDSCLAGKEYYNYASGGVRMGKGFVRFCLFFSTSPDARQEASSGSKYYYITSTSEFTNQEAYSTSTHLISI